MRERRKKKKAIVVPFSRRFSGACFELLKHSSSSSSRLFGRLIYERSSTGTLIWQNKYVCVRRTRIVIDGDGGSGSSGFKEFQRKRSRFRPSQAP